MNETKSLIGKYMGKELATEGDKDGRAWKKYKLKFQVDDKNLSFAAFTPWNKVNGEPKKGENPKDLEEGEHYKISYTEYKSETMENASKTIVTIFKSKPSTEQQLSANSSLNAIPPSAAPVVSQVSVSSEEAKALIGEYFKVVPKEQKSVNHFIGTIIKSLNKELVAPLIEEYNKHNEE